ncbi:MAG TPA: glycoside hydrolase family 3 C-terminal domain-containing protein [Anaerolineae bacterium]|nr:glycoside hydrolase family 3 C-terminal domain-containing protein [Anaerolineae bacterium]HQI84993.1 glycoside hydrolase family 3 C-terminal domain-containing protein [Anaerolineae bacterium]
MQSQEKIKSLIAQMTLAEKASLCSGKDFWYLKGIERLRIPSIMVTDGPHGLRKQAGKADHVGLNESVPATCFPTASALAATWNRDLIYQVGQALGEECRQEKVGVILGPGANIKRSPLCGRNFEYFSEDPYLTGEIAKSHINGVQSQGIGTSIKHYAVNNQEFRRMTIDAVVDERALHEIYLPGYEIAVKGAQPWTVMCSYNKINGVYACENAYLMTDLLKDAWGHEGLVVTDWGAMNERVAALQAGVELEMPGTRNGNDAKIVAAVEARQLDEAVLDRAVERIVTLIFKAADTLGQEFICDMQAHHALARRVAAEGAVLLKNDGDILPLQKTTRFALIGRFAKVPRYQGAGSSLMNPTRLDNLYAALLELTGADSLPYAPGYTEKGDQPDETLIQEALALAEKAELVIICAGLTDLYETEGVDRTHMKLPPGHDALIQRIAAAHPKVVVVLSNGSPVEMPWVGDVPCILEGYLGGQAGAGGIADILLGQVNPSGKLAETFPLKLEDTPAYCYFPGGPATVEYRESLYVGYRYYDTVGQPVLFPFGHGLSYTRFAYRDLAVSQPEDANSAGFTVTLKVKNTGKVAGQEVVQLYVRDVESTAFRPAKELKGFAKVALQPGEETNVTFDLDRRAFAFYDPRIKDWRVEAGVFEILVGASSQDIRLSAAVELGDALPAIHSAERTAPTVYYDFPKGASISQEDFEILLGHPVPPNQRVHKGFYTLNTPIEDMHESFIGRQFASMMKKQMGKMVVGKEDTPMALLLDAMSHEMPLRSMLMGETPFNREMLEALLLMMNGQFFKGLSAFARALVKK